MGNGVVIDPIAVAKMMDCARKIKVTPKNLMISDGAHLVLPYHRALTKARSQKGQNKKIGTTARHRPGMATRPRASDCAADLAAGTRAKTAVRIKENNAAQPSVKPLSYARPRRLPGRSTPPLLATCRLSAPRGRVARSVRGRTGTLDIDHGTYPTSRHQQTAAHLPVRRPPHRMDTVLGVMKAYHRVGEGPSRPKSRILRLPRYRRAGATTGRARRCGWFDAAATLRRHDQRTRLPSPM
jgi:adenylosuccinate synthase